MRNVTKHFTERWVERIVGITNQKERDDYISRNRQMITEHANETFEHADFIYKGAIGDNITKNYYIKDDNIYVTNTSDDAFITIYKIDLGFTPELNATVRKGLMVEIAKLTEEKNEIDQRAEEEVLSKYYEADKMEDEIKILELQVANMKKQREFIKEEAKMIQSRSLNTGLELKRYTMMLVNSKEYKDDLRSAR
jgi:hypothetical protein